MEIIIIPTLGGVIMNIYESIRTKSDDMNTVFILK